MKSIRVNQMDLKINSSYGKYLAAALLFFSACSRQFGVDSRGESPLTVNSLQALYVTQQNTSKVFDLKPLIPSFRSEETTISLQGDAASGTDKSLDKHDEGSKAVRPIKTEHGLISEIDDKKTLTFRYTPDKDFFGTDHFVYELNIGATQEVKIVTQSIIVEQVPYPPVAPDQKFLVDVGTPFEFALKDLSASDPQGSRLSLVLLDDQDQIISEITTGISSLKQVQVHSDTQVDVFLYLTSALGSQSFKMAVVNDFGLRTSFRVSFESQNALTRFRPALAVRNTSCVMCHASIKGNLISDFNSDNGKYNLVLNGVGDLVLPNWEEWVGRSVIGTSFIEGTYYVPRLELSPEGRSLAAEIINESKTKMIELNKRDANGNIISRFGYDGLVPPNDSVLEKSAPNNVATVSEYLNSVLNYRTDGYLSLLKNYTHRNLAKAPGVNPNRLTVREIPTVKIGAPPESVFRKYVSAQNKIVYFKQGSDGLELSHFSMKGNFAGNDPGEVMDCDGDLFVDGPVFLNELKMNSKNGCRIYATGTVFIQAPVPTGGSGGDGVAFVGSDRSNLQISSSRQIMLGIGSCSQPPKDNNVVVGTPEQGSLALRQGRSNNAITIPLASGDAVDKDYNSIRGPHGEILLKDAGDCQGTEASERKVAFKRILLNAPRIDSRYTGNVQGVVIAEMLIWSLGDFFYTYDPIFDQVPALPAIDSKYFFDAEDCITSTGKDRSRRKDKDYRACEK